MGTATSVSTWRTADEYARTALGELGAGKRGLIFVFDPDLQLRWPEDGSATVVDFIGRPWRLLSYRGNDLSLRARFIAGIPTAVWVRPAPLTDARSIDITTLADLVELADDFVDVSLAGMLGSLLPGVPLPTEVAEWAPGARDNPPQFAQALAGVLAFRGKPVSRRHVLAAAVMQASARATPEAAWLDDSDLIGLVTSYLHLLALDQNNRFRGAVGAALMHVASLVAARFDGLRPTDVAKILVRISSSAFVSFVYVLAAARRHRVPAPLSGVANQGLAPGELASLAQEDARLPPLLVQVADHVNECLDTLRVIAEDTERRKDAAWLKQLGNLLQGAERDWQSEPTAGVRLALLSLSLESDAQVQVQAAPTAEPLAGSPRFTRAAETLEHVARALATHGALADSSVDTLDVDGLVHSYITGLATAEYDFAMAERGLRGLVSVLGDVRRIAARIESSRSDSAKFMQALDARLAHILGGQPGLLADSPHAIFRWLPTRIGPRVQSDPSRRFWLLVFDGLRWDLWERVVRPEFEREGWQAEAEVGLAVLPTETAISRRALLAGSPPDMWISSGVGVGEEALARRAFARWVNGPLDLDYRLKAEQLENFIAERPGPARINIRVFRIPDHLVHHTEGGLLDVASQLRTFLRENVLPELRIEVSSDDLLFVATDHGFSSISPSRGKAVLIPGVRVRGRVVDLDPDEDASILPGLTVGHNGVGRWQVATEDWAFVSLGERLSVPSLRHGGASLSEIVVPLVGLRRPTRVVGGLELELNGPDAVGEDESASFVACLKNQTGDVMKGQIVFETNLEVISRVPISLASGSTAERKGTVRGREGIETLSVRFVNRDVTLIARSKVVKIRLKPGIKLGGLDKLEDDW